MASGVFIRASSQSLAGRGIRWIFTAPLGQLYSARPDWLVHECGKAAYVAGFGEIEWAGCTILRHGAVNGMHSIEKACSYKGVIFVDVENRRSKNRIVL